MPSIEPEELPRRRSRGELLEHIYAEGARRRRRRRLASVGLSVAALAAVAGAVLVTNLPGGTPQHVATRGQTAPPSPGSTTSSSLAVTTTATPEGPTTTTVARSVVPTTVRTTAGAVTAPSTTIRPVTTEPEPGPTTTQPSTTLAVSLCVNSTDPACGPFHWLPEPSPNAPLVIEVTPVARAADPKTYDFAIVYTDADAPIADGCRNVDYGDGESASTGMVRGCAIAACIVPYGAWTPPVPQAGRAEATVTHTFATAGTYEVRFTAVARHALCTDPYYSSGDKTITVVVP